MLFYFHFELQPLTDKQFGYIADNKTSAVKKKKT